MNKAEEKKLADTARAARVEAIAARFGAACEWQGDPRGYPLTLTSKGGAVSVPGRGLPARCFSNR